MPAWHAASEAEAGRVQGKEEEKVREITGGQTVHTCEELQLFICME